MNVREATAMDVLLENLSAKTPDHSAPNRQPSSRTAAKAEKQALIDVKKLAMVFMSRALTHKSLLPRSNLPLLREVLHDQDVGNHTLVVTEGKPSY